MATHGYIQIAKRNDYGDFDRVVLVEAVHDGYMEDMYREVIEGLVRIRQFFLNEPNNRPRLVRDTAQRAINVTQLIDYFQNFIPLDDEVQMVISGLAMNSPLQFTVQEVREKEDGKKLDFQGYSGLRVEISSHRLPYVTITNTEQEPFGENPRWLHYLVRKHFPLHTQNIGYKDGIVCCIININLALAEWAWNTVHGKKNWNFELSPDDVNEPE